MVQLLADQHKQIGELQSKLSSERADASGYEELLLEDRSQITAAMALLLAYQKVHDIASSWAECPCPLCGKVEGLKNKVGL